MITITVKKAYGAATVQSRISAPTIERAIEIAGANAQIVSPIEPEAFFCSPTPQPLKEAA